jgi:membrane protein YqaA with SNARE-associated domain
MTLFMSSIAGACVGFFAGLIGRAFFERQVYPTLSARHEAAKATLSHSLPPSRVTLIGFPVLGYFILGPVIAALGGR